MADAAEDAVPNRRAAVYVGRVEEVHHGPLGDFFEASWGRASTAADIAAWRADEAAGNPIEPGVEPPKWIFLRDDRVLGYLGTIPDRFQAGSGAFDGHWLKGFWVDPEFRSGPVGYELLKCAVRQLGATSVSTVAPEARRLFEALGLQDRGVLFNRLRLLRPGNVLSAIDAGAISGNLPSAVRWSVRALQATRTTGIAGAGASAGTALGLALLGRSGGHLRVARGWEHLTDDSLDRLWERVRHSLHAATFRDARLVRWRYGAPEAYVPVSAWAGSELVAWAMVRRPSESHSGRLAGVSVASLSDLLFGITDPRSGLAVVAGAERVAADLGADALLCSGTHAALRTVLARRAFLPIPGNVHFMARDDSARIFPSPLESWWLTRGDAQSDGAF